MKIINKILGTVISVLVAVMVLACCWQVITRFLLNDPSQWTEEFLRYALIWMTMLGAPYAYGKDQHLSIRVLVDKFQSKNQIRTKIAVEIIVLILSIAVFIVGGIMQVYYVCIPISGCLMVLYCLERLKRWFTELKEGK